MKKALTVRQKTVQMLLERWRQKQEDKEMLAPTTLFAQKPSIKIDKTRRQASHGNHGNN
jgi:hypothetical protein